MKSIEIVDAADVKALEKKINALTELVNVLVSQSPMQIDPEWINFEQACFMKGINKKTARNKPHLMPNAGTPDGKVGGRMCWKKETVIPWLSESDESILKSVS